MMRHPFIVIVIALALGVGALGGTAFQSHRISAQREEATRQIQDLGCRNHAAIRAQILVTTAPPTRESLARVGLVFTRGQFAEVVRQKAEQRRARLKELGPAPSYCPDAVPPPQGEE